MNIAHLAQADERRRAREGDQPDPGDTTIERLYTVEVQFGSMRETLDVSPDPQSAIVAAGAALESLEEKTGVMEIVIRRTSWYSRQTTGAG